MADASALLDKVRERAQQIVDGASQSLVADVRSHCPVKTGFLEQSILDPTPVITSDTIGVIIAILADYATYVDEGTAPHVIHGNPLLAFEWKGREIVVRSVQHPGTAAQGWPSNLFADWGLYLQDAAA